jgi:hypothetical protein
MNGTAAMDATITTEHTISTSLNRHGKRFVQCFVFSKIDISVSPYNFLLCAKPSRCKTSKPEFGLFLIYLTRGF